MHVPTGHARLQRAHRLLVSEAACGCVHRPERTRRAGLGRLLTDVGAPATPPQYPALRVLAGRELRQPHHPLLLPPGKQGRSWGAEAVGQVPGQLRKVKGHCTAAACGSSSRVIFARALDCRLPLHCRATIASCQKASSRAAPASPSPRLGSPHPLAPATSSGAAGEAARAAVCGLCMCMQLHLPDLGATRTLSAHMWVARHPMPPAGPSPMRARQARTATTPPSTASAPRQGWWVAKWGAACVQRKAALGPSGAGMFVRG